jgi:hypothetical protein
MIIVTQVVAKMDAASQYTNSAQPITFTLQQMHESCQLGNIPCIR